MTKTVGLVLLLFLVTVVAVVVGARMLVSNLESAKFFRRQHTNSSIVHNIFSSLSFDKTGNSIDDTKAAGAVDDESGLSWCMTTGCCVGVK